MNGRQIDRQEAQAIHAAAVVRNAHLAAELERLGFRDEDESLEEAHELRPVILKTMDEARSGRSGEE